MKLKIMSKATRVFGRAGLHIKKHSPEILMIAGIAGTVTSTVLACKATMKVNKILEEKRENVEDIHRHLEIAKAHEGVTYTEEDHKRELTITYAQTGVKLVKLYTPSVLLGVVSISAIVSGHNILKKRNIALAAAYAVTEKGFKEYRKRVVERFGDAIDKELRFNLKAQEVDEIVVDKKGNETTKKAIINVPTGDGEIEGYSIYARFFDDGNTGWSKDPEASLMFLRRQQDYANEILKARGHIFLNEVYDMLGIPRSKVGQAAGWIYNEKNNEKGDNYVDFGIYANKEANRRFVNGYERVILLDFNPDGDILNLI